MVHDENWSRYAMPRLQMSPPGYCFTIEHGNGPALQISSSSIASKWRKCDIIQFKHMAAAPNALCMKHISTYDRFYKSYAEAFRYMEEQGYKIAEHPRTCYIDGAWNQDDPEQWLYIIQIPIE